MQRPGPEVTREGEHDDLGHQQEPHAERTDEVRQRAAPGAVHVLDAHLAGEPADIEQANDHARQQMSELVHGVHGHPVQARHLHHHREDVLLDVDFTLCVRVVQQGVTISGDERQCDIIHVERVHRVLVEALLRPVDRVVAESGQ